VPQSQESEKSTSAGKVESDSFDFSFESEDSGTEIL